MRSPSLRRRLGNRIANPFCTRVRDRDPRVLLVVELAAFTQCGLPSCGGWRWL
jgi:hypothetical protein